MKIITPVAAPSYHSKFTLPTRGDLQSQKSSGNETYVLDFLENYPDLDFVLFNKIGTVLWPISYIKKIFF